MLTLAEQVMGLLGTVMLGGQADRRWRRIINGKDHRISSGITRLIGARHRHIMRPETNQAFRRLASAGK